MVNGESRPLATGQVERVATPAVPMHALSLNSAVMQGRAARVSANLRFNRGRLSLLEQCLCFDGGHQYYPRTGVGENGIDFARPWIVYLDSTPLPFAGVTFRVFNLRGSGYWHGERCYSLGGSPCSPLPAVSSAAPVSTATGLLLALFAHSALTTRTQRLGWIEYHRVAGGNRLEGGNAIWP
jgi:hypothetical protein